MGVLSQSVFVWQDFDKKGTENCESTRNAFVVVFWHPEWIIMCTFCTAHSTHNPQPHFQFQLNNQQHVGESRTKASAPSLEISLHKKYMRFSLPNSNSKNHVDAKNCQFKTLKTWIAFPFLTFFQILLCHALRQQTCEFFRLSTIKKVVERWKLKGERENEGWNTNSKVWHKFVFPLHTIPKPILNVTYKYFLEILFHLFPVKS